MVQPVTKQEYLQYGKVISMLNNEPRKIKRKNVKINLYIL